MLFNMCKGILRCLRVFEGVSYFVYCVFRLFKVS